jgi:hypothetical protein
MQPVTLSGAKDLPNVLLPVVRSFASLRVTILHAN